MIDIIQTVRSAMVAAGSLSALTKVNFGLPTENTSVYPYSNLFALPTSISNHGFKISGTTTSTNSIFIQVSIYGIDTATTGTGIGALQLALDALLDGAQLTLANSSKTVGLIKRSETALYDGLDLNKNKVFHIANTYECQVDR